MRVLFFSAAVVAVCGGSACGDLRTDALRERLLLEQLRAALPAPERLEAKTPESSARAPGDAWFPAAAGELVAGVNGAVAGTVGAIRAITAVPPTLFNSDTEEFFWGPWPDDNPESFGTVAAYLRRNPHKEDGSPPDFEVGYALLRGVDADLAHMVPVVWGGITPDLEDPEQGHGLNIWDLEAHYAFVQQHMEQALQNPSFDADGARSRGRFAAFFGRDVEESGDSFAFVYAVFRNFIDGHSEQYEAQAARGGDDFEYLYGLYHAAAEDLSVSFLDLDALQPRDGAPDVLEGIRLRMAFLHGGMGRGELLLSPADIAPAAIEGVECWSPVLERVYFHADYVDGEARTTITDPDSGLAPLGTLADCGPWFAQSLDALQIASLQDVDPALRAAVQCLGDHGVAEATSACADEGP